MKALIYLSLLTLATTACSVSKTADDIGRPFANPENNPQTYSDSALAGKIFGQDWTAVTAVARPIGQDGKETSVSFFAESPSDVCKNPISQKPYASVVIPRDYGLTEYHSDMATTDNGNPLTFTDVSKGSMNLIAEKTRLRINSMDSTGFEASVYAYATELSGAISEINGKIHVTDCSKVVDFSVWNEFIGWYTLTTFDGAAVNPLTAFVEKDTRNFYDRKSSKYLNVIVFPLFDGVSGNSSSNLTFGPMDGLGQTTLSEKDGVKTLKYSYHGPLNFQATDVTLNLDMTVVKSGNTLNIDYTLEVPKYIKSTTHRFTLKK